MVKYFLQNGQSLLSACKDENNYKNCYWLIKNKHLTPDEALTYKRAPATKDQHKRQLINSRRFRGYADDELNISTAEARQRGYRQKASKLYHGQLLSYWAKESGLTVSCLWYRIEKMGMSLKEAMTLPSRTQTKITYKGKTIKQLFGRQASTIFDRIAHGWSVQTACETPIDSDFRYKTFAERGYKPKVY